MPGLTLTPPTQMLPISWWQQDTPPPNKTVAFTDVKPTHILAPCKSRCERVLVFSLPLDATPPSEPPYLASSEGHSNVTLDASACGESEEEHTLSAYGDLSLSEDFITPPSDPLSESGHTSLLQPKSISRPRLRLKVRRPPMPKRRLSYIHVGGPLSYSKDIERARQWPGSPSPIENGSPWHQHQPLVSPLPLDSRVERDKTTSNSGSSVEKLVHDLMPHSPSIRLSPPGSPSTPAIGLPQGTNEPISSDGGRRNLRGAADKAAASTQPPQGAVAVKQTKPVVLEDKPKSGGGVWRTRLPPRLPIPKWDV
ncbi:hypothetical protein PAXINDRAFT_21452 [Paxillus involutus ATCC 200175]|uniref:Uncharacterized protein n=1 Tax=Paxillus involutus ATCC 200175 TaxID=664439 RepID=A0A0C9STA5_PAXIN|nr:hypothetical protein PAXINDRAFT_21452 [Paxillus involutus ATCC 200175]